jgi:hypothetical protein
LDTGISSFTSSATGIDGAAEGLGGQRQQAVVGPDERRALSRSDHDRAAVGSDAGVDDRQVHGRRHEPHGLSEHVRAGAQVLGRDRVGDVEDLDVGSESLDDAAANADELVLEAVVAREGQEAERHGHRYPR